MRYQVNLVVRERGKILTIAPINRSNVGEKYYRESLMFPTLIDFRILTSECFNQMVEVIKIICEDRVSILGGDSLTSTQYTRCCMEKALHICYPNRAQLELKLHEMNIQYVTIAIADQIIDIPYIDGEFYASLLDNIDQKCDYDPTLTRAINLMHDNEGITY